MLLSGANKLSNLITSCHLSSIVQQIRPFSFQVSRVLTILELGLKNHAKPLHTSSLVCGHIGLNVKFNAGKCNAYVKY